MVFAPRLVHDRLAVSLRRGKLIGRCDLGREGIQEPLDYVSRRMRHPRAVCLVVLEPQAVARSSDRLLCEVMRWIVGEENGVGGARICVTFSGEIGYGLI